MRIKSTLQTSLTLACYEGCGVTRCAAGAFSNSGKRPLWLIEHTVPHRHGRLLRLGCRYFTKSGYSFPTLAGVGKDCPVLPIMAGTPPRH
jgi:hypothetical protein